MSFDDIKVNFDSSFRNWFDIFGLTEFNFILPYVADLFNEEDLVDVYFTPFVDGILDYSFAFLLT